jgi:hypothetical protein
MRHFLCGDAMPHATGSSSQGRCLRVSGDHASVVETPGVCLLVLGFVEVIHALWNEQVRGQLHW